MTGTITSESTVYEAAPHCVVRPQEEQYLIYNPSTDELHLLSPIGFYLYSLCDGSSPLDDVQTIFASVTRTEAHELQAPTAEFLEKLRARGLIRLREQQ